MVKLKFFCYRPSVAQRVGRILALLYHDRSTRRGWIFSSTPWPHFTPGKDPMPIAQGAGWTPGPVWTDRKSRPNRIRSRTIQPVISLYTDWATWPTTWGVHIDNVTTKLSTACYVIRAIKPLISHKTLLLIFHSRIHTVVSYEIILWENSWHSIHIFQIKKQSKQNYFRLWA